MTESQIEALANALFQSVIAPTVEEADEQAAAAHRIGRALTKPERQQATTLAKALLAEEHAIERASYRLNK